MKSFSPAGMATKAYYGLGARTFGNPDGALTGGGAYAAGGANPNGPNQGGGGGGGGVTTWTSFRVGISSTGPWTGPPLNGGGDGTGYADGSTNFGFGDGAITPAFTAALKGLVVSSAGWQGQTPPVGTAFFLVVLQGVVAQNFFSSILLGAPANLLFHTATATFFDSNNTWPGFTGWFWQDNGHEFTFLGDDLPVTIT